jgi:hypothetical protein
MVGARFSIPMRNRSLRERTADSFRIKESCRANSFRIKEYFRSSSSTHKTPLETELDKIQQHNDVAANALCARVLLLRD